MKILRHEPIKRHELLDALKQTRLRGLGQPLVYEHATLSLEPAFEPSSLVPAQNYVLTEDFERIKALYYSFSAQGIDIFELDGGLRFWPQVENGEEHESIPLIPPVIEESLEPDGQTIFLINDGMHRVYAAKQLRKKISIVLARNVPSEYPYYAYAHPNGWRDVVELDELPKDYVKKRYRDPENYKALFRDFNAVFPGVQKQRKKTNPAWLRT
uniref:ParB-like catalytic effector domain-containing protein n=1 Tax=Candidatus Kentrum sp. TUN TaxID=2126343 RepID=A0A451AEM0_9GAMM|nr:MAG: hypothetical protein BECKTUN1418F_GA0071002_11354 [Candidatus Kentron sp. TUN]VFK64478.1 MAG: hypothetical protein BECKTUN1418D_GA0071000_12661 [Candidatus Kentron sp. TUN]VFK67106.1 MAG: hypothetical protein BECKTUN1418E_GA0071001_11324 [Candidatus Kentron sp. TUN]